MNATEVPVPRDDNPSGTRRSTPGQGQQCFIYMLGRADRFADSVVHGYGQISAGCGPNLREDFADTIWPVVVKVKPTVTESDLTQHLRDLADVIEQHPEGNRTKPMMNETQTEAFKKIVNYLNDSERSHFVSEGEPDDHIYRASMVLEDFVDGNANPPPPPEHPYGQAGPIRIVRDHPSHDEGENSQGPSVVDRGSREIEWRWAKEAIGLTAVDLNEAYAQFEIDRDGCTIPSPHLRQASARLLEVMKRLGIADYREIDTPLPF